MFIIADLNLSIIEIIVLQLGGIVLGIAIHFFIISRRGLKSSSEEMQKLRKQFEEWKLKYFNEAEIKDKEFFEVKFRLKEANENNRICSIELEELRRYNKKLQADLENKTKHVEIEHENKPDPTQRSDVKLNYMQQLREARNSLVEHNQMISQLLQQIDVVKEKEEKQIEILKINEDLTRQLKDLKYLLNEKETEINKIRQKEQLTIEMTSMLDNAYREFNILQGKMQKLESQAAASRMINIEYEDMKEGHQRITQEVEQLKSKLQTENLEKQEIIKHLNETKDKLIEVNFQRQQLQKRVSYLEELNNDMQIISDTNKKLEGQMKSIGELESKLNLIAEQRDHLLRQQPKSQ